MHAFSLGTFLAAYPRLTGFPLLAGFTLYNPSAQSLRIDFAAFITEGNGLDVVSIFNGAPPTGVCPSFSSTSALSGALFYSSGNTGLPSAVFTSATSITFCFFSDSSIVYSGAYMRVGPQATSPSALPRVSVTPTSAPISVTQYMFCSSTVNSGTISGPGSVAEIFTNTGALTGSNNYLNGARCSEYRVAGF